MYFVQSWNVCLPWSVKCCANTLCHAQIVQIFCPLLQISKHGFIFSKIYVLDRRKLDRLEQRMLRRSRLTLSVATAWTNFRHPQAAQSGLTIKAINDHLCLLMLIYKCWWSAEKLTLMCVLPLCHKLILLYGILGWVLWRHYVFINYAKFLLVRHNCLSSDGKLPHS